MPFLPTYNTHIPHNWTPHSIMRLRADDMFELPNRPRLTQQRSKIVALPNGRFNRGIVWLPRCERPKRLLSCRPSEIFENSPQKISMNWNQYDISQIIAVNLFRNSIQFHPIDRRSKQIVFNNQHYVSNFIGQAV